jgi:hypothetical protein
MAKVRFLANSRDLRPGQEGVVYGAGHETTFDESDYEYVKQLRLDGMAEITDDTPPEAIFKAPAPAS